MSARNVGEEPADPGESVQEAFARLEEYKSHLSALVRQQELIRMSVAEHERATQTLEAWDNLRAGDPMLAPVGAETFVHISPGTQENVLIGIGSSIVVEVDRQRALEILGTRKKTLDKADQDITGQVQRIDSEAQYLSQQIESEIRRQQGAGPAEGP